MLIWLSRDANYAGRESDAGHAMPGTFRACAPSMFPSSGFVVKRHLRKGWRFFNQGLRQLERGGEGGFLSGWQDRSPNPRRTV